MSPNAALASAGALLVGGLMCALISVMRRDMDDTRAAKPAASRDWVIVARRVARSSSVGPAYRLFRGLAQQHRQRRRSAVSRFLAFVSGRIAARSVTCNAQQFPS